VVTIFLSLLLGRGRGRAGVARGREWGGGRGGESGGGKTRVASLCYTSAHFILMSVLKEFTGKNNVVWHTIYVSTISSSVLVPDTF